LAELRPFRAVHYNQSLVNELSAVICPPYDIITPQLQQELYQRSQYNFVRLEHARKLPQDTAIDNKDARSAATLDEWLEKGILMVDDVPAIYLHDHYFAYQGREYKRRGMVVCVRLEEWDKMIIRPHEGTLSEPKSDRLSLLWACRANTSPVLSLFEDQGQQVSSLLTSQEQNEPLISLSRTSGESHWVWAITEPGVVNQICNTLANQPLYIADGHHRYESALMYQREKLTYSASVSTNLAFNFVLMELVDFDDSGLIILPPHRLVRGISKSTLEELMAKLSSFFEIEKLPLTIPNIWRQVDDLFLGETSQVNLVLFGLDEEHLFVLRLHDLVATSQMMPYFHCELYKRLGVSIVDHIILEKLLGVGSDREEPMLGYSYDKQDAVNKVLDREYQLAFILNPIKPEVVKAIADVGDRMPRKSTYFYPKLPAGLVFHRLV
jgi:uncharacterized protein (DUF1015 family)